MHNMPGRHERSDEGNSSEKREQRVEVAIRSVLRDEERSKL